MRDTDYAFCVARLRANEKYMLGSKDIDALIDCGSYDSAVKFLADKKWIENQREISDCIAYQSEKLWQLLKESVPDKSQLDILCLVNDFFNIKAAVKCHFTGSDAHKFYIYPTTLNLEELTKNINSHDFSRIAGVKGQCAADSYKTACLTENGQNADIIIDRACINALCDFAGNKKDSLIGEICAFLCDTANIKIAIRCAKTKKGKDFLDSALGECSALQRDRLISSCLKGEEELYEYLSKTAFAHGAEIYKRSSAEYEKWCDDEIISMVKKAKFTCFGFDPVCAYYYGKLTEIKTVRIILTAIKAGADKETVKERVRALYV